MRAWRGLCFRLYDVCPGDQTDAAGQGENEGVVQAAEIFGQQPDAGRGKKQAAKSQRSDDGDGAGVCADGDSRAQ